MSGGEFIGRLNMAQEIEYIIIGSTNKQRSPELDRQFTSNFYIVYDSTGIKPYGFVPTPGILLLKTLTASTTEGVRQLFSYSDFLLVFIGTQVFSLNTQYNIFPSGNIATDSGTINICNNNSYVLIVDQINAYVYTIATKALTTVNFASLTFGFSVNPLDCTYFDNYFIICLVGTNQWYISSINDPRTWDPLQGNTISVNGDTFQGIATINNRLFLFGHYTTEVWFAQPQTIGTAVFPFTRDNNMLFEFGCAANSSIAHGTKRDDGVLFWLSSNSNGVSSVMMTDGGKPIPISPPWLDKEIQQYENITDAIGFAYQQDGYVFYQLTFPSQNITWLCKLDDEIGPTWTNLESFGGNRHIANCYTYFQKINKPIIGAYNLPNIYHLSSQYNTNDGISIKRTRIGNNFCLKNYNRFIIHKIEIDFEAGVGNANNPGEIPYVFLSLSYDQAHTFKGEKKTEIGRMGQYVYRSNWYGRGIARSLTVKIETYDPVRIYLSGCSIDITPGLS